MSIKNQKYSRKLIDDAITRSESYEQKSLLMYIRAMCKEIFVVDGLVMLHSYLAYDINKQKSGYTGKDINDVLDCVFKGDRDEVRRLMINPIDLFSCFEDVNLLDEIKSNKYLLKYTADSKK